jgi:hypothetical protein
MQMLRPSQKRQMIRMNAAVLLCLTAVLAAGCGGKKTATVATVTGAANGARSAAQILSSHVSIIRPAAPMGVFVTMYLAGGGLVSAHGALNGAMAGAKLVAKPGRGEIDDTFSLLEELGTVLQVDIADMLNRAENRPVTLDDYLTGLSNITVRAQKRQAEMKSYQDQLKTDEAAERKVVSTIDSEARKALQAKDYVTSGQKQQELAVEQAKLAQLDSQLKEQQQIQTTFTQLLDLSKKRTTAITSNREIILSGLKVVDVPGSESLGILENTGRKPFTF